MNLTMKTLRDFIVPEGSLAVWWLGQASFLVKSPGGILLAIDPYLSDSCGVENQKVGVNMYRIYPPCISPAELAEIDLYVLTHTHLDHLDPETLQVYRQNGGLGPYLAPPETMERLVSLGIPQEEIILVWPNKRHTVGDITLQATLAIPFGSDDLNHVGYLISAQGGPTFYFTGDTAYHEVIGISVAEHKPNVMFTVINGMFRNLSPSDAAMLANQIQPQVVIPYHYDLFPEGQMPPHTLKINLRLYQMQERFMVLGPGNPWVYKQG